MDKCVLIAGLVLGCMLTACANGQDQSGQQAPEEIQIDSPSGYVRDIDGESIPVGGDKSPESGLQRLVDLAKQDLAARLAVQASLIETVSAQYVTWRDSALGCPEPGHESLQVLTSGTHIKLSVNGRIFHYHSGGNRSPFLCRDPDPLGPLPYGSGET